MTEQDNIPYFKRFQEMKKKLKWLLKYADGIICFGFMAFMAYKNNWWAVWGFFAAGSALIREKISEDLEKWLWEERKKWHNKYLETKYGKDE